MKSIRKNFIFNFLFIILGLILIYLFSLPFLRFHVLNIGNKLGLAAGFFFILIGIFFSKIIDGIKSAWSKNAGKIFLIFVSSFLIFSFTIFLIANILMLSKISWKNPQKNIVIVLGCQVIGENPSIMLSERINAAYNYLLENPEAVAILSGGQGKTEAISEAECIFRNLVKKGISENRLLKEDKSTSTEENLLFSKKIIEENQLSSEVVLITNEFHCYRAEYMAKKQNLLPQTYSAKTHWYLFPTFYLREICAITAQCIF